MRNAFAICLLFFVHQVHGQYLINLHDSVFMNIQDAYVVVNEGRKEAIITTGAGGGQIVTEEQEDIVKWMIGRNTGRYVLPWGTAIGAKVPFVCFIPQPMEGEGWVEFNTYATGFDNTPFPSPVLGVSRALNSGDSAHVVDRFWEINYFGYIGFPRNDYTFTYEDPLDIKAPNVITESKLEAIVWTTSGIWSGPYSSTADTIGDSVLARTIDRSGIWSLAHLKAPPVDPPDTGDTGTTVLPIDGANEILKLWPNPSDQLLNFLFFAAGDAEIKVNVYGIDGRLFMRDIRQVWRGENLFKIHTARLAAGEYFLTLQLQDGRFQKSLPFQVYR